MRTLLCEKMPLTYREGLVMYWCEGDKSVESHTYRVGLTSCDSAMLKLFVQWLEEFYKVGKAQLKVRLHFWPDVNEEEAKAFWAKELEIPISNFTKSWTKPRGRGLTKRNHPNGVCRVSVSSKKLLQLIINGIEKEFSPSDCRNKEA